MMPRLRLTLLVPLVTVALYVVAYLTLGARPWFRDIQQFAFQTVSTTGCLLGTLSFARGDYLRRAWRLYLLSDLLVLFTVALTGLFALHTTLYIRVVATFLANILGPLGAYRMATAWRAAGIELPAGGVSRRAAMIIGLIIGCVLAVPGIVGDFHMLVNDGDREALVYFCGALGDISTLALVAPIVLTALALRGGQVSWVWGLLSASMLLWLTYDLVQGLLASMSGMVEGVRVAALSFTGAAGLAQRIVTRSTPRT